MPALENRVNGIRRAEELGQQLDKQANESEQKAEIKKLASLKAREAGDKLLDEIRSFIRRFCVFQDDHALTAVTLWAAHAHMVEHFHTTPRLALLSPEPGSGKTRVLEVLDLLVPESMLSVSPSPAAIFRTLAQGPMTLLLDECDTIFSRKGKDDSNEDLRALLNSGYKRGATIPRCVGPKHEVQKFGVFCATALAGLGDLPYTVMSRSVIVRMRRRAPNEQVDSFRTREHEPIGHAIREVLSEWALTVGAEAGSSWPTLPDGIVDRPSEVWEPLLAVADVAGGEWPEIARKACVHLCKVAEDQKVSLGVRLLSDLRTIFGDRDALHTETILQALCADDGTLGADAPWGDLHGKPLNVRGLASMLKRFGVSPLKVKVDGKSLQGYRREHLWDAWIRYLPPVSATAEPAEPSELPQQEMANQVPEVPEVPQFRQEDRASRRLWRPAGNGTERGGWRTTDLPGSLEEVRETLTRDLGYPVEVRE